ncbi:hypothetical protein GCM10009551_076300 [Nocardiopsis tropica]
MVASDPASVPPVPLGWTTGNVPVAGMLVESVPKAEPVLRADSVGAEPSSGFPPGVCSVLSSMPSNLGCAAVER